MVRHIHHARKPENRRTAVAEVKGRRFSGFLAWWMWRTIYWLKLPRMDRRIRVATDWTLDLVFPPDTVQLGAGRPPREDDHPEHAAEPDAHAASSPPSMAGANGAADTNEPVEHRPDMAVSG